MAYYKNNVFYYIIERSKTKKEEIKLIGPLNSIYELKSAPNNEEDWAFVQIEDKKLVRAFRRDEIYTTKSKI